ncbi:hypothetical protein OG742_37230 [Streptomyces sp. NBC_00828]|uniref:hypothetical protein n=1 Tax=Streptomyces sp. NBC_00828 TaxID=2903678 RepID=UPI0038668A9F
MTSRLRTTARVAGAGLLIAALSSAVAAGTSWLLLNDTSLSDTPAPARTTAPPTSPAASPTPDTTTSTAPQGTTSPWPLGSCVTSWQPTTPSSCTTPGALRIVGSLHRTRRAEPCGDLPETTTVRRVDSYTLCLSTL